MIFDACELKCLHDLHLYLDVRHNNPMIIYYDTQSTTFIVKILAFYERTKHIDFDCHFTYNEVTRGYTHPLYLEF
ncbi:hypothetical protein V2J09_009558 [Rumex salicifolius]